MAMYGLFAHVPGWLVLVTFAVVPAAGAVALHAAFRRRVPPEKLLPHHEVAGFLVAVVGVLYAVILGFLVVSVWASFDLAQRNADAETNDLSDLLHIAQAFPEPARSRTRFLIARYVLEIRDREWAMLQNCEEDLRARAIMLGAFGAVAAMRLSGASDPAEVSRQTSLRDAALATFHDLTGHRRQRVLDAQSHIPPTMYFVLVAGGMILLAFVFLFGIDNRALQLMMTALVAGMIGLQVGLVFELDRPYWGAVHVSGDAWNLLIRDNHLESNGANPAIQK